MTENKDSTNRSDDHTAGFATRFLGWLFIILGLIGTLGSLWAEQIWAMYDVIYSSGATMQWIETLIPYYPFVPFFPVFAIMFGAYLIVRSRR